MRKMINILCYVAAGFFAHMLLLLAFISEPPFIHKLIIMGIFSVPAIVFFIGGSYGFAFRNWQRDLGIVLLSASLMTLLEALFVVCAIFTPELNAHLSAEKLRFLSDYLTGFGLMGVCALIGAALIRTAAPNATGDSSVDEADAENAHDLPR